MVIHMEEEYTRVRLMRLSKAAAILDVSVRTIKRYIQRGVLHGVKLPGGDWRVYADEVYALIGEIPAEDIGDALGDEDDSPDRAREVWS
jgi:excisionase family DNA binding protein